MQITKYTFIVFLIIATFSNSIIDKPPKQFLIILDPAGDVKKTGRSIDDSFERGITLQCAEQLKSLIEEKINNTKVIITRLPGDIVYDLQNASLSNRLNANLFISINFYYSAETKPTLFLYTFSYGNDFVHQQPYLTFLPYEQAYKTNQSISNDTALLIKNQITSNTIYNNLFTVSGPHKIPIKPLIGVIAPSICIEMGIKNKKSYDLCIEPIFLSIKATIDSWNAINE